MSPTPVSKATAYLRQLEETKAEVEAVQAGWQTLINDVPPGFRQCSIWLTRYGIDIVTEALDAMAVWLNKLEQAKTVIDPAQADNCPVKSQSDMIRYASGIMVKLSKESEDGGQ